MALLIAAATLAGCASQEKQWMKVGQSYTTTEFRRDHAECSAKGSKLDDDCMRARGWVDVKPSKGDRAADTPAAPPADWRQRR